MSVAVSTPFSRIDEALATWWRSVDRDWRALVVAALVTAIVQLGVSIPW